MASDVCSEGPPCQWYSINCYYYTLINSAPKMQEVRSAVRVKRFSGPVRHFLAERAANVIPFQMHLAASSL